MINDMWKWLKGLFVKEEPSEGMTITLDPVETKKEKEVTMTEDNKAPSASEAIEAIKSKRMTMAPDPEAKPKRNFAIKVPAGTMNRKMRRFLLSMGWGSANGDIMAPRKTTPQLWVAINSLMINKKYSKAEKRKVFKRSFGK